MIGRERATGSGRFRSAAVHPSGRGPAGFAARTSKQEAEKLISRARESMNYYRS